MAASPPRWATGAAWSAPQWPASSSLDAPALGLGGANPAWTRQSCDTHEPSSSAHSFGSDAWTRSGDVVSRSKNDAVPPAQSFASSRSRSAAPADAAPRWASGDIADDLRGLFDAEKTPPPAVPIHEHAVDPRSAVTATDSRPVPTWTPGPSSVYDDGDWVSVTEAAHGSVTTAPRKPSASTNATTADGFDFGVEFGDPAPLPVVHASQNEQPSPGGRSRFGGSRRSQSLPASGYGRVVDHGRPVATHPLTRLTLFRDPPARPYIFYHRIPARLATVLGRHESALSTLQAQLVDVTAHNADPADIVGLTVSGADVQITMRAIRDLLRFLDAVPKTDLIVLYEQPKAAVGEMEKVRWAQWPFPVVDLDVTAPPFYHLVAVKPGSAAPPKINQNLQQARSNGPLQHCQSVTIRSEKTWSTTTKLMRSYARYYLCLLTNTPPRFDTLPLPLPHVLDGGPRMAIKYTASLGKHLVAQRNVHNPHLLTSPTIPLASFPGFYHDGDLKGSFVFYLAPPAVARIEKALAEFQFERDPDRPTVNEHVLLRVTLPANRDTDQLFPVPDIKYHVKIPLATVPRRAPGARAAAVPPLAADTHMRIARVARVPVKATLATVAPNVHDVRLRQELCSTATTHVVGAQVRTHGPRSASTHLALLDELEVSACIEAARNAVAAYELDAKDGTFRAIAPTTRDRLRRQQQQRRRDVEGGGRAAITLRQVRRFRHASQSTRVRAKVVRVFPSATGHAAPAAPSYVVLEMTLCVTDEEHADVAKFRLVLDQFWDLLVKLSEKLSF
ncbi:hypothetical protein AMAG_02165 [Allomyces macrogynus ATCC 38327]|uniref:Uncharacterized protein n=1 Tax=Allomyces macrogynus (strain ATCC 38327) TaxID=578462 RepID=A0A0L0S1P6_ALLM3|nr:hypothetical protein AMAG_02165 [Allomyces macrogynus ATCC 38327]|eukprot:KNE56345.1 hypothetical protein AMAG_02165 [Allomyces macrogynus ATCC 38327]